MIWLNICSHSHSCSLKLHTDSSYRFQVWNLTFHIPDTTRLLSWAPHEEVLLETEESWLSVCLSLTPPSSPNLYMSCRPSADLSLSFLFLTPSGPGCTQSPVSLLYLSTILHVFVYFLLWLTQARVLVVLFVCSSPLHKPLILLSASFFSPFVSPPLYPAVCLFVSFSMCVSRYSCRDFLTC